MIGHWSWSTECVTFFKDLILFRMNNKFPILLSITIPINLYFNNMCYIIVGVLQLINDKLDWNA